MQGRGGFIDRVLPMGTAQKAVRVQVMMRLRKETEEALYQLGAAHGLRAGPMAVHIMESVTKCHPDNFHAAMAEFLRVAGRR